MSTTMWSEQQPQQHGPSANHFSSQLLQTNGQPRLSKSAPCSPLKPLISKRPAPARADSFHVIHKVPVGDTPYVKAKHVQLVDKDPNRAIALFWAAINAGDRVDSALKDMAIVMKQQNRPEEAIEAIKSLRYRCSDHAQESLDNVLLDLYKRCGRLDDQIALLKHKLHLIHQGLAFNGRRTKTARSQGKKFQVSIEQEATRLLGNLGWAYMQQSNFVAAEAVYRKALSIEPDNNKVCNLGICLMKQGRLKEAKAMLQSVKPACGDSPWGSDSHLKSFERAQQMLKEMEAGAATGDTALAQINTELVSSLLQNSAEEDGLAPAWRWNGNGINNNSQNHLTDSSDLSGALFATAGFGPAQRPPLPPSQQQQASVQSHQSMDAFSVKSHSNTTNKWEEEDAEQGFADENSIQAGDSLFRNSTNWHAEALLERLEKVVSLGGTTSGNANSKKAVGNAEINGSAVFRNNNGNNANSTVQSHLKRSNSTGAVAAPFSVISSVPPVTALGENNGSLLNSMAAPFVVKSAFHRSSTNPKVVFPAGEHDHKKKDNSKTNTNHNSNNTNTTSAATSNKTLMMPLSFDSVNYQQLSLKNNNSNNIVSGRPSQLVLPERLLAVTPESKKTCCKSLSFGPVFDLHIQENAISSPDAWSRLGFIQGESSSPLCTIATVLRKRQTTSNMPSSLLQQETLKQRQLQQSDEENDDEDDECQRRLKVFVEMTLPEL